MQEQNTLSLKDLEERIARKLPYNILAEQMLLGSLLMNNEDLHKVNDFLEAGHFYEEIHQRIYSAICLFYERSIVANPITLKNHFEKDKELIERGGANYLANLAALAVTAININDYARMIYELALRRSLIEVGNEIVNDAYDKEIETPAHQQVEVAEQKLYNLSMNDAERQKGFVQLKSSVAKSLEKVQKAYKNKGKISGISSKFTDLDNYLGGFQDSDLIILAGRPAMGKTAFAVNIAMNACKSMLERHKEENIDAKPKSIGFFSLEMSSEQIANRIISMTSGIDSSKLRTGFLIESDFDLLVNASSQLEKMPFFIDDTPALTISALRTRARRLKRMHNLGMIFVDYLQLLRSSSASSKENRVQEISEITQGLKAIAKELNIPVLALSQLSRAVEQREDKRPLLSDLRESGSIEQDADIVMFIYREEYYASRKKSPKENSIEHEQWKEYMSQIANVSEIIIAKHRSGPVGDLKLFFDNHLTQFKNIDLHH